MEIVINIPKEWYESIMNGNSDALNAEFVKKGIVLPEGHGRLIDVSKLHQDIFDDNCWQFSGSISPYEGYSWKQIQNAPTIIEADKGGK